MHTQYKVDVDLAEPSFSATDRVAREILNALEERRLVPGQRLIETDLALSFGVGRNAVREAIQRLAAKGIVDLARNRSPAIRQMDLTETMEVLEVAEEMFALVARVAAREFRPRVHAARVREVARRLQDCRRGGTRASLSAVRRDFYRVLLDIGSNRELRRHFATIQMQIIYAQFESDDLSYARLDDYGAICDAVITNRVKSAETSARSHVRRVRQIIQKLLEAAQP